MKYYIIKPVSHKVNSEITKGISQLHKDAIEVKNLYEADEVILQKGWTRLVQIGRGDLTNDEIFVDSLAVAVDIGFSIKEQGE